MLDTNTNTELSTDSIRGVRRTISAWWKRARIFHRFVRYKLNLDERPAFGVLTVNGSCNFRCNYCFADYYLKKNDALPLERMLKTIDELHAMGVIYLNVHGGEALIRNDIGTILDSALAKGMFVNLITNGALIKRKWKDICNVNTMCISLDGMEENNDKNRGQGTFQKATEAIEFVLAQGMTVRVAMTITKHTMKDIRWVADYAKKRKIYVHPFLLFDQDNLPENLRMSPEENRGVLRELIKLKKQGYPIFYSFNTLNYALNWPYDKATLTGNDLDELEKMGKIKKDFKFTPCNYKTKNVLVEYNGTVRACNVVTRNILHVDFTKGKSLKEAKEELHNNEDCRHCYHLPQTEMSHLMQLNLGAVVGQAYNQIKEDIKRLLFDFKS